MTDPYRQDEPTRRPEALLAEEREILVKAGKVMIVAGGIGLLGALVGLAAELDASVSDMVVQNGVTGLLSGLTLVAGLVLARLPGGSRDYTEIEKAIRSLAVVFTVKGVILMLMAAVFVLPFVLLMLP